MNRKGSDLKIEANGITISYDDFGHSAIPVILIHGFPFNKSSWQPQIDFLQMTKRVIAYDIRGFGNSSTNDDEVSMDVFADDLIKLMDALKIEKSIVCGLSMGGYIVLNAVNRFPDRFEAIVLCDTQSISDTSEIKEKRTATIKQIESDGLFDFTENFVGSVLSKTSLSSKKQLVNELKSTILSTPVKTITSTLISLAERKEMREHIKNISVPTLVLCGIEDMVTPVDQSSFMIKQIPNSTLHSINGAGHLSNLEQPEIFNKHLGDFVFKIRDSFFIPN
ncbi:MAG: alpha/beta hydrolase [Bacteroidetes bacterium]|nr:alpha/beta hydrolase [Bacteroidota bacterium]